MSEATAVRHDEYLEMHAADLADHLERLPIEEARELLRSRGEEERAEDIAYLYVTDAAQRLVGIVSLRDLIFRRSERRMSEIMNPDVKCVRPAPIRRNWPANSNTPIASACRSSTPKACSSASSFRSASNCSASTPPWPRASSSPPSPTWPGSSSFSAWPPWRCAWLPERILNDRE